jgi:cytochrome P450
LSEGEILAVANLLFAAGAETTTNLIGNGLNALFNHPDQLDRLWADPSLVPTAVEEILRFDSPVQIDGRACLEPAELAGVGFQPGDRVLALLGAANRDPDHFAEPETFDIGRSGEPIMSFASGIHYCLGANLSRVEGQEVFAGLIRRFAAIAPAGDRPYRQRLVLRGLERCPITVTLR